MDDLQQLESVALPTQTEIQPMQKVYIITYISKKFLPRAAKLKYMFTKLKTLKLVNEYTIFTEGDIRDEFKQKMGWIWNANKGGGYWSWKPYLICDKLTEISANDILIYIDGGCDINLKTTQAIKRLKEYIKMVNDSSQGVLRFELPHIEKQYINLTTVKHINNMLKIDEETSKNILSRNQLVGGIMVIRKTEWSVKFMDHVMSILYADPQIVSDVYSCVEDGIIHRHDQSLMSYVYKSLGGNLIIPDETARINGRFNYRWPIMAARHHK